MNGEGETAKLQVGRERQGHGRRARPVDEEAKASAGRQPKSRNESDCDWRAVDQGGSPAPAPAPLAEISQTPTAGKSYKVVSGDNLWKIAKKAYNNGNLYIDIFNANKNILKDPSKIYVGQVLTIPAR